MPIAATDENGLLPPGVHACKLQEIERRFGRFRSTDQRTGLFRRLRRYLEEAKGTGLIKAVVINGSFVTDIDFPNDIDMFIVVADDYDFRADVRPFQFNMLSNRRVRRRFGFDVLVARDNSTEYAEYIAFYQQVRGRPELTKGILRVEL